MSAPLVTDVCIIGGGSGGLSVAAGAAQMGARVVLIEGHKMGGDCLNYGCVPSKALIAAARRAHAHTEGAGFGVTPGHPEVDYAAAKDHVAATIAGIAPHDSPERFRGLGVDVIEDWGRFVSPTEVEAGGRRIRARRFVIATGSAPFVPPIPGLDSVAFHTNETIFDLRERPEHLIVIGGGPIGLEMAQAHRRLGSRVTVLEGMTALGKDDPEIAAIALAAIRAEGVEIIEGALAERIEGADGTITVHVKDGAAVTGSHLLVAVGRRPNTGRLNLEAAGITTERGAIPVDAGLRTANRRVYAIGDVTGGLQFTHVAGYQAGVIVRSMLFGLPAKAGTAHIPWTTYTDPEVAQVGLTEEAARKVHGAALEVVRVRFDEIDRGRAELAEGLLKVMIVKGRPVGASMVGPHAGELIQTWALALSSRLKMSAIAGMVAPYPSLGEINKRAASAYFSPRLFGSRWVKRIVRLVQRLP